MAGDRGASDKDIILPLSNPKVWKNNGYLMGYYGTMHGELLQNYFTPPKLVGDASEFMRTKFRLSLKEFYSEWNIVLGEDESFGMLIGVDGKIFEHNYIDMSMTEYTNVDSVAIGSGGAYAMGSLFSTRKSKNPVRRLQVALKSATFFSPTCLEPIDILS